MRIAFFSDNFYPELSGIAASILTVGKELARRGHAIHYFVPRYAPRDFARLKLPLEEIYLHENIGITRFASLPFNTGTEQGRLVIPSGRHFDAIRAFRPDAIHVHLPFGTELEGLWAARKFKVPLLGTNHTPGEFARLSVPKLIAPVFGRLNTAYTTWFYNQCDFVSAPCSGIFREMKRFDTRIPHEVVSNPLEPDRFYPRGERQRLKEKFNLPGFTALFTGRLSREKNIDVLIHATAELRRSIPQFTLALTGKGPMETSLRALAERLGVSEHVRFLGFLPDSEMEEIYNAADVFTIASTVESQCLSAMQAMLSEMPVVGVKVMGLEEYVKPGAGFLVQPHATQEIVDRVQYLYHHPDERLAMGRAARKSIEQFTKEGIAATWERIYRQTISAYHHEA